MVRKGELNAQATANVLRSISQFASWPSVPQKLLVALAESMPTKVRDMTEQALSNCLLACGHLREVAPDVLQAVPAIVAQIPVKAKDMIPQALSNCLWAFAKLREVAPDVLQAVPAVVAYIPDKAKDMKPQELSNCLWASAQLREVAPNVLEIVPVIAVEAQPKIRDMSAQQLSNSLEALVSLQESVPEVAPLVADVDSEEDMIRSAAARLNLSLPGMRGKDLVFAVPAVVWACAKLGLRDRPLMNLVAQRFGSRARLSSLPAYGVCALSWSYRELGTQSDYADFQELLGSEVARRGFSQADVQSCELGRSEWSGAKRR
eukprot:Skav219960  [mRNA]  locus=scaffold2879:259178:260134:+ [translate_table: standard]